MPPKQRRVTWRTARDNNERARCLDVMIMAVRRHPYMEPELKANVMAALKDLGVGRGYWKD